VGVDWRGYYALMRGVLFGIFIDQVEMDDFAPLGDTPHRHLDALAGDQTGPRTVLFQAGLVHEDILQPILPG
jgi:hypothetical protein